MKFISTDNAKTFAPNSACASGVAAPVKGATFAQRFRKDERGATAMMFGLLVTPVIFLTGMAVDFNRTVTIKNRMQTAIDAATLAGVRAQMVPGAGANTFQTVANNYYQTVAGPWLGSAVNGVSTLTFQGIDNASNTYKWTAETWIKTPFMAIINGGANAGAPGDCSANKYKCAKVSAKASVLATPSGNNNGYSIETSFMLDITGSMSGQKLTDLKAAANAAIDILVWKDQSKQSSRLAIVPFAQDVRLPTALAFQKATGQAPTSATQSVYGNTFKTNANEFCVVERTGANRYTDASPGSNNSFSMIEWTYTGNRGAAQCNVPSNAAIQPLTDDTNKLHTLVNGLQTAGGTAGHLGTAWAWYTLSPSFNDLWDNVNRAKSYDNAYNINTKAGDASKVKLKKIAVLMTDGDYNTQYNSMGIDTGYFGDAAANDTAENQAKALCTGMKAQGIEVYTVGFGTGMSAASKTFLKGCATDVSHYYDATTGDALNAAFKDIALKISQIRMKE